MSSTKPSVPKHKSTVDTVTPPTNPRKSVTPSSRAFHAPSPRNLAQRALGPLPPPPRTHLATSGSDFQPFADWADREGQSTNHAMKEIADLPHTPKYSIEDGSEKYPDMPFEACDPSDADYELDCTIAARNHRQTPTITPVPVQLAEPVELTVSRTTITEVSGI